MESLIVTIIICFTTSLVLIKGFKKFLEKIGITGNDMQKKNKPKMATSGGIPLHSAS